AFRCARCGAIYFPQRLMCVRCGSVTFDEARLREAVIEEVTTIRHVLGQRDWRPCRIASVRTPEGLQLTVGLRDESGPRDRVLLEQDGTAPFGRAVGCDS